MVEGAEVTQVTVPNGRDRAQWPAFCARLQQVERCSKIEFSFKHVDFVTPGWMLIVAQALKGFRDRRPGTRCRVTDASSNAMIYAGHSGFFDAFGLPWSNPVGAAATSSMFVPVTVRTVADLFKGQPLIRPAGEIVQEDAQRLAALLAQAPDGRLFETLSYAIREMLRNVIEHSKSKTFHFAAQCWPAAGAAEIAISDAGIGIAAGLSANRKYNVADDASALLLAIQPGVSGVIIPKHSDDAWANSGYGLYMASGLADGDDGLLLASGEAALIGGGGKQRTIECALEGTCVVLRLRTGDVPLVDRLQELVALGGGEPSGASMSARVEARKV